MMKLHAFIFLMTLCLTGITAKAQTPFDSFAPETSRPMSLSHEFGHFLTNWYNIADYGTWYDGVLNDEKLVVNFENLIRNENHLDTRKYYGFPSVPGGSGDGEIPQWDWVGNYLEIITNGL